MVGSPASRSWRRKPVVRVVEMRHGTERRGVMRVAAVAMSNRALGECVARHASLWGVAGTVRAGVGALLILRSARADRGDADFWGSVAERRRKAEREERGSDF